jgi:HD superfamily phosphodiesterase
METGIVQAAARYAEKELGSEGFRYVSAVVANCKMLAVEIEVQEEHARTVDMEALVLAAYLHDISTPVYGYRDHHLKSAEMAVSFLQQHDVPEERIRKVEQAILTHTTMTLPSERDMLPFEGRILYDADKLGRLSGLAVVIELIEFGAHYPNRSISAEVIATKLRHIEESFIELYQSLNTEPACDMAREKFGKVLDFLDGVIEHVSDATPV